MRDILFWVVVTELLGAAALPGLRAFFGNRRDAALLCRPVGLALVAWLGWAMAQLLTGRFNRGTLIAALLSAAVASYFVHRRRTAELGAEELFGPEEKLGAAIFWGAAAVFLIIRAAASEIVGTEKFMDLAFLTSLTRREAMPPLDPWMAGRTINYYYWGYLLAAVPAKLASIPSTVGYNLALPTFAGFSSSAAACLGFRLSKGRLAAALSAAGATVFAGNLAGAFDALRDPLARGFDYWPASRVIGTDPVTKAYTTISEFPFFTFFHADLHPHLLAFPFFIAAFAVAHRFLERGPILKHGEAWTAGRLARPVASGLLVALVAGTSVAANKWTLPAIAILLVFAGVFRATQGRRLPALDEAVLGAVTGIAVFAISHLLFRAYETSYSLPERGLGRASVTSGFFEFFAVWGTFLVLAFVCLRPTLPEDGRARQLEVLKRSAVVGGSFLLGMLLRPAMPILTYMLPLAILAGLFAWRALRTPEGDGAQLFTGFLLLFGLAMILGCEVVYFKDAYGDTLQRMNTIFKFYNQAWPLVAIAVAVLAEEAWRRGGRSQRAVRGVIVLAAVVSVLYPARCLLSRLREHSGPVTLDARLALERRNPGDAAAIAWLEKNAPADAVVLEASGDPYSEFSRIATHTGIPTVLGWANHESLWRADNHEIDQRRQAIQYFYTKPEGPLSVQILQRYHVTHVVIGDMERRAYPGAARVGSLPYLVPVVTGSTTVYSVIP